MNLYDVNNNLNKNLNKAHKMNCILTLTFQEILYEQKKKYEEAISYISINYNSSIKLLIFCIKYIPNKKIEAAIELCSRISGIDTKAIEIQNELRQCNGILPIILLLKGNDSEKRISLKLLINIVYKNDENKSIVQKFGIIPYILNLLKESEYKNKILILKLLINLSINNSKNLNIIRKKGTFYIIFRILTYNKIMDDTTIIDNVNTLSRMNSEFLNYAVEALYLLWSPHIILNTNNILSFIKIMKVNSNIIKKRIGYMLSNFNSEPIWAKFFNDKNIINQFMLILEDEDNYDILYIFHLISKYQFFQNIFSQKYISQLINISHKYNKKQAEWKNINIILKNIKKIK